jgi:hypothetical protein
MDDPDPILKFAKGNQALAGILRSCLTRLVDGTGGKSLQWMARETLAGRFDLRQLAKLAVLQADAQDHLAGLVAWKDQVGQAEFERQADHTAQMIAAAAVHPAPDAGSAPKQRPGVWPPEDPRDTWADLHSD